MRDAQSARVSVVIPHLNQHDALRRCMASVMAQVGQTDEVEVIVADNGSTPSPDDVVAHFPSARLVAEDVPGPGPARNAGVAISKGDILAFIDADCLADHGWLAAIRNGLGHASSSVIGGDVRVSYRTPGQPSPVEPYEAIYGFRNREYIADGYSGTGNLAMWRSVYDAVGGFAGIDVAEDQDWGHRARDLGFVTVYEPDMIIYHPARENFAELTRKWDRHIAHEFGSQGNRATLRWLAKAAALGVSPIFEIPRVATTDRVGSSRERVLAFLCLVRIRWYRARRMLGIAFGRANANASAWNREGPS